MAFTAGGRTILEGITARIEAGPRTVILGPNGAGKSVLMRVCHGLLAPTAGAVKWNAPDRPGRRRQAMVFQRPVMLRRSAWGNIIYALKLAGVARKDRKRRAQAALERVGLSRLAQSQARVLSVGEQQRLALARAWAMQPEVLFLDEPTAGLDPTATGEVHRIIQAIHDAGTKIVMTTHNLSLAKYFADEILFLNEGQLLEQASAERFFTQPASAKAQAFLCGELLWH
ncbi:ATP-binding cassette domain-containing protein [Nitrosococcus wardiae]|uniref:ATP-binding cassette domain-containing protein n=1 Tax=Nitrosococcus wardiae TaxID=1814290 RepID=UPI001F0F8AE7|nr:ATP-binding cassette domain-containing protein [Nitrosococcus wardiae]